MKIIKIPYSLGALSKSEGINEAPDTILNQLKDIWLSENFHKINYSVEEINFNSDIKTDLININKKLIHLIEDFTVFVGGDHSITYACFKAISMKHKNCGLVIFDAHPDCYKNFNYPVHEDWLKFLIEEKVIRNDQIILIGIRNPDIKEIEFLKDNKIKFFTMKNVDSNKEDFCDLIMESCRNFESLYISIDIDVVDPAFAPGTGYLEPGGFSSRELIHYVQRLKLLKNLRAIDLVEVNPKKDINNMTSKLAARLIAEFM